MPNGAVRIRISVLLSDAHLNERGFVIDVTHPEAGIRKTVGLPWKIGGTPDVDYRRSPLLGESNDYVFREILDLSDEEIEDLRQKGVIE